jgi:hypothetical protein
MISSHSPLPSLSCLPSFIRVFSIWAIGFIYRVIILASLYNLQNKKSNLFYN